MKIEIIKLKCKQCNHEWIPRKEDVRRCPKCKTYYFDREKVMAKMIGVPIEQLLENAEREPFWPPFPNKNRLDWKAEPFMTYTRKSMPEIMGVALNAVNGLNQEPRRTTLYWKEEAGAIQKKT